MRRFTFALTLAAALAMPGCLQKDTTSTICLRPDGSFDWMVLEQNVRSDESSQAARLQEEAGYADTVSRGNLDAVNSLLALGGEDVRVRWLRDRRPYAVMVDARFDSLAGVFDRMLSPCEIPYQSAITESEGVTTWRLRANVGIDGDRLEMSGSDACGQGAALLQDLRIILETGSFTEAKGFVLHGSDTVTFDDDAMEENAKSTGILELSLSWKTR